MEAFKFMFFGLVLICSSMTFAHAVEYGEDCNDTEKKCKSAEIKDPIICSSESRCVCDTDMFRHVTLDRCVSPHTKQCTLRSDDGLPIRTCTEFAECWPEAEQGGTLERKNGSCHCDMDAKHDPATDQCKLQHGSTRCRSPTDCDVHSFLTCREGACECYDVENQVWDNIGGTATCVVLVGGSCAVQSPFPKPPSCSGPNTNCNAAGVCECLTGFIATPDKRSCGKSFEGVCGATSECHPQFECLEAEGEKKCRCPVGQEYHEGDEACRLFVNEPCGDTTPECTLHADCTNNKCGCVDGYVSVDNKTCVGSFGSSCTDVACDDTSYLECKEDAGKKTCECKANYDTIDNKCIGHIDQSCRNHDDCIANSQCHQSKTCGCGDRQEAQDDMKLCLALHGDACNDPSTPCSSKRFLLCLNDTCDCADLETQLYDQGRDFCVGKADSSCGAPAGDIECTANSTCSDPESVCRCDANYIPGDGGQCVEQGESGTTNLASSSVLVALLLAITGKLY